MTRLTLTVVVIISVLQSCIKPILTKDNIPALPDTLAAGWTMTRVNTQLFTDIHFVQNNGIAVSTSAIFGSTDGGITWKQRLSYGNDVLGVGNDWRRNLGMDSIGNVIIPRGYGNSGSDPVEILLSSDYSNFSIVQDNFRINDCWFEKNKYAYAITANEQDKDICFLSTANGGSSWKTVSIVPKFGNIIQIGPTRLSFIDSQTGWAKTAYGVFKTTNGGLSWTHLSTPPGNIVNVCAIDANTCYIQFITNVAGRAERITEIDKTTDGGATWYKVFSVTGDDTPISDSGLGALQFVDANTAYMASGMWIYKSTDGGTTWSKVVSLHSSPGGFTDLYFADANHGWACATGGQILRYQR